MCLRLVGNCLCCCCQLGLKLLLALICSILGILIILAIIIYFCFFYNKSATLTTVPDNTKALATDTPARVRALLQKLIDSI